MNEYAHLFSEFLEARVFDRWGRRKTLARARRLRREATIAERILWQHLRKKKLGVQFRRQHPIGPWIVDFYCAAERLLVEVDGPVHDEIEVMRADARREDWLRRRGFRILRVRDSDVLEGLSGVLEAIREALWAGDERDRADRLGW